MKRASSFLVCFAISAGCLALTGCARDAEDIASGTANLGTGVDVPNPSGAYFASVTANGTGCPAGTWDAAISPDGKAFTVTFSQYEALVDPGQSMAIKDCTLGINLKSPSGFSFAVDSFHYQGYALLDQAGMTARQTAKYYFMGNPVPAQELRSDMNGPYDNSYVFSDDIGIADLVWSPCGVERSLIAQTRLVLQNNAAKSGTGYLNTSSVDGEIKMVFTFGLTWEQCGNGGGGDDKPSVPIYRGYNGAIGDHLQGLGANEGAPAYTPEGVGFTIFASGGADRAPLFRCRVGAYHFLSGDPSCEGQIGEGQLGYVAQSPAAGLVQIFRCLGGADHLTTANPQECTNAGFQIEGPQGYAAP